jgi:diaminopimelate decarboxylase/aspartate kinase
MSYIVYKLGGTSQCKIGYDRIINILKDNVKNNIKSFIVLSAVSCVTNNLVKFTETKNHIYIDKVLELNYNLIKELELEKELFDDIKNKLLELCHNYIKSYDMTCIYEKSEIIGYGEVFSTNIFYKYIDNNTNELYIPLIELFNSYDFIKSKKEIYQCNSTTEFYFDLRKFNKEDINNNQWYSDKYDVNIFQGFIGSTPSGNKVLLGRGGSDTTGSLIANAIDAIFYEVWTDVDGIYTADPRIFDANLIPKIDYELIQELASMGAKVMHPLSIKSCFDKNIPIYVKNTFNDKAEGTKITNLDESKTNTKSTLFYALQKNETIFKIKSLNMWNSFGFLNDIFRKFSENKIDVNIVTTSQFSVSATTSEQNKYKLLELKEILSENYEVSMINDCTVLSVVTREIKELLTNSNFYNINSEIIHISDNNMTINIVLRDFNPNIVENFRIFL